MTDGLDPDLLSTLDADPPSDLRVPGELLVGERVADKYTVARLLGRGAMGMVYLAHDERLGRDVAIKVGLTTGSGALARAEREAQTLAKLTHPNVVVIFEVGEHDRKLFVAMEYVSGGTARAWLAARKRSWREIVALYAGAGAGLAAAHAAGIVHRDFKPDNVLVGDDGRPRVADFGLARAPGDPASRDGAQLPPSPMSDRLTRTGGVVGTPAYMAPEQLTGRVVDELADQFAFCVALWEALHGTRPFAGSTAAELYEAMAMPPKPTNAAVPRDINAALTRGLARDPAARWPSLGVLVARLRRHHSQIGVVLGVGAALVVAAVAVPLVARHASEPCGTASRELASSWNPRRELVLHAALGGAGGEAAWPATDARLGDYAARWLDADRAACHATGQSPEMLDKRAACLAHARSRLGTISDAIAAGGKPARIAANGELALLPDLASCGDVEALAHEAAPPTSPAERVRTVAVDHAIGWARAHELRGELVPAGTLDALVGIAHAAGWAPVEADAIAVRGLGQLERGEHAAGRETLEVAASSALAAGDDDLAAHVMIDLAESFA